MSATATELSDLSAGARGAAMADASAPGRMPAWDLNARQQRLIDGLLSGAHAPLHSLLGRADYNRVLAERRLVDGTPCAVPLALDISEAFCALLVPGSEVLLRGGDGEPVAVLTVQDIYWPDHLQEALCVHGSSDRAHPRVAQLLDGTGPVYLGGRLRAVGARAH